MPPSHPLTGYHPSSVTPGCCTDGNPPFRSFQFAPTARSRRPDGFGTAPAAHAERHAGLWASDAANGPSSENGRRTHPFNLPDSGVQYNLHHLPMCVVLFCLGDVHHLSSSNKVAIRDWR